MHALIGAYRPEGHEWLDELKAVLTGNVDYAYDYITKHFQGVSLAKPEGTYMLLLDCEQWCERHGLSLPELGETRLGCGRRMAGRRHVPGPLQHPRQSRIALEPRQGGHAPP